MRKTRWKLFHISIVVTYEIRIFFEGAQKEVFSSILKFEIVIREILEYNEQNAKQAELKLCPNPS
jgi:hypothetical protein